MLNTRSCYLKQLIYCYNNANFTIAFLSEKKKNFLRCKVHSVRHTSLTFSCVKLCKWPEVNSEPTWRSWIIKFNNNGKAFPIFDGMGCSYSCHDQLYFLPGHWQAWRYRISWDLQKPNSLENNPNNSRNNMKSQIKNKKNRSISLWKY